MSRSLTRFDRVAPAFGAVLPLFATFVTAPNTRALDRGTGALIARGCVVTTLEGRMVAAASG